MEDVKKYKVIKHRCLSSLKFFTKYFHKNIAGEKFIYNFHHDIIIDNLTKTSNYEYLFLNINIPPRYTKTLLSAIMFISWSLARNPRANFIYITGSDKLANETSSNILKIINHPDYKMMFGVELAKDQKRKDLWRTKEGGGLMCSTIFGQITGFGAGIIAGEKKENRVFEGAIIFDDINKIHDSVKQTANNQKVNEVIFDTVIPSRQNSSDTPIINIQQRAGADDATKNLREYFEIFPQEKIKDLVLPVIFQGKPLWESKHSFDDIERIRVSPKTAFTFESQYMQNPTDKKGLAFPADSLQYFELSKLNRTDNFIANLGYIDTADAGEDNYSHPICDLIGNRLYLVDVIFNQDILSLNKGRSILKIQKHNSIVTTVETNKEGTFYKNTLQEELPTHSILGRFNSTNKHARIINFEDFIKKFMVFRSDYEIDSEYHLFMKNLVEYKKDGSSKHDDAPDSLAGLAYYVFYNYGIYLK